MGKLAQVVGRAYTGAGQVLIDKGEEGQAGGAGREGKGGSKGKGATRGEGGNRVYRFRPMSPMRNPPRNRSRKTRRDEGACTQLKLWTAIAKIASSLFASIDK